jgi:signal transduction histidine kinase
VYRVKLFQSPSFRLTLLSAAFFCISAVLLFTITYFYAEKYAEQGELEEIGVEFARLVSDARASNFQLLPGVIAQRLRERGAEHGIYLLQDRDGRKLAGNVPAMKPIEGPTRLNRSSLGNLRYPVAEGHTLENGQYLLIGEDLVLLGDMHTVMVRAFASSIGLTLLFAMLGGLLISRYILRRVSAVSETSRAIIAGDLSQRIRLRGVDDEFDHLAISVNAMLDRIVELMKHTQQVTNDIAHDLRTPLTRLRQRLERARRSDSGKEVRLDVLDRSIEDVDAILKTFGALLRIAQIEAGGRATLLAAFDFSRLLTGLCEDFQPAARDHGRHLSAQVSSGLIVHGDRELLMQMTVNLIDNAIHHSTAGADIRITADSVHGAARLIVADNGGGIPPEERERVFRPFYRLEPSRKSEGSGLGLSLVAAIVKQHRATIALEDNLPGLRVVVVFPPCEDQGVSAAHPELAFDAG